MRPSIICNLTPDAVALLQLVKSRNIDFQKIGTAEGSPVERARDYLNDENPAFGTTVRAKVEGKRGTGRSTTNGVSYRLYRKGQYMDPNALVTVGPKPLDRGDTKMATYYRAIFGAMTEVITKSGKKVLAIPRDQAIEVVRKVAPTLTGYAHSGAVSALYKAGALKIVI